MVVTHWDITRKILRICKSLTSFGAMMCVEHLGKVSFKSDKFRYLNNSLELTEYAKKQNSSFSLIERFRHFSHLIKAVVSVVMPPTNRTQRRNTLMSVSTKRSVKFAGKGKPERNIYLFVLWTRFFNHKTKSPEFWSASDRQANEA